MPVAARTPRAPVARAAVVPAAVVPELVAPAPRKPVPTPAVAASPAVPTPPALPPIELPDGLDELRDLVLSCRRCRLHEGRTTVVFGEGDPRARVMFVGEAPGAREDETGRPFVGAAGQLLTKIIEKAVGVPRASVYIANVNKCRPPNNRNPEPDEVAACLPYLRQQIRAIRPAVIVALGRVAAHNLLGTTLSMSQLRTMDLSYEGIPVVATWHPAYLLRQPEAKRDTWEDIKRVNRLLGRPEIPPSNAAR
ncbi:MAG: uracil-DNA glycosylase [Planctomycetes bacterium]|nr:uracil-DNA glycosylase [Planctomycetota bacterium]